MLLKTYPPERQFSNFGVNSHRSCGSKCIEMFVKLVARLDELVDGICKGIMRNFSHQPIVNVQFRLLSPFFFIFALSFA